MNLIDKAIIFATKAHENQVRKGTDIPYITHPFGVGMLLMQFECSEEVIAAGLLHDTLEDTATTLEEIEKQFGADVARLVVGASEPNKNLAWEDRKTHTLLALKVASLSQRMVICADKLHNVRSIKEDQLQMGEGVWNKFSRGKQQQAWYYSGIVVNLGYQSRFPMLEQLQEEVMNVFGYEQKPFIHEEWQNSEFFDDVFKLTCPQNTTFILEEKYLNSRNASNLIREVHDKADRITAEANVEFEQIATYLNKKGVKFDDLEQRDRLLALCTVLKNKLNLTQHGIYIQLMRHLQIKSL
jgi:hypothetical protein